MIKKVFYLKRNDLRNLAILLMPKTRSERLIFAIIFIVNTCVSFFFIFHTFLLDHPTINYNTIFGFDNPVYFKNGYNNINNHPFIYLVTIPIVYAGNALAYFMGYKAKTVFIIAICTYLVVQGQILIRRYLLEIIQLKKMECNLITIFFALFASNLVLTMLFESFTFSFFLLCCLTYYFSDKLNNNRELSLRAGVIFAFATGAVTLNNILKSLTPFFFEQKKFKEIIKKQAVISITFIIVYFISIVAQIFILGQNKFLAVFRLFNEYSTERTYQLQEYVQTFLSQFFGSPMLLPEFTTYIDKGEILTKLINYTSLWQYAIAILIFFVLVWSIIINRKVILVQFIVLNLVIDLILHVIFKYGLWESFIYAGQWVFCIPILIGWLLKRQNKGIKRIMLGVLVPIIVIIAVNNYYRLYELYLFGLEHYGTK